MSLEGKTICLQNIKRELLEQLGDLRAVTDTMEEEINQLRADFVKARKEKENLEIKMKKLEVILKKIQLYFFFSYFKDEVYCKSETSQPPVPPPPPPKSFLSSLKLTFKKKTKRSVSVPGNMNIIAKQGKKISYHFQNYVLFRTFISVTLTHCPTPQFLTFQDP